MKKTYPEREYSILLIPEGEIHAKLSGIINKLSDKYNLPKFEPHITLIGKIDKPVEQVISKTYELSKKIKPYKIRINKQIHFNEDYQSLFLKGKITKKILRIDLIAKKIFSDKKDEEYLPHLSLMYKNSSLEMKEQIRLDIRDLNLKFKVKKIHLFSTANGPKNWYKVKEFDLRDKGNYLQTSSLKFIKD